jgi:putative ABC transport system permease protein
MVGLAKDFAQGLRGLQKSPSFSVVAIAILALGIGANAAIFSLADLIIRRPVALPEMDHLVVADEQSAGSEDGGISPANYLDLRSASKSFEQLSAYQYWSASDTHQGQLEELHGVRVTANFFTTVGVRPTLGRTFLPDEEVAGRSSEVIISSALWKQRFSANPRAVGKTLELNGEPHTVIGVMPARATFPLGAPAFWIPLVMDPSMRTERHELALYTVGRLRTGTSLEQTRAEINTLWRQLTTLYPEANRNRLPHVVSLRDHIVLDYNRQFAFLLMGVVGFVLLIVCANIATLELARGARRRPEIAIRSALGATRLRLFRQLLVESMILAFAGGGLGVLLAVYGVAVLRRTLPSDVRWFCDVDSLGVNVTGLLFTTGVAIVAGLLAGLAPAWQHSRVEISSALADGGGRIAGRRGHGWRSAFVVTETALAIILLIGAALMVKGFGLLAAGPAGLEPGSLLTFHLTLPESRYPQPQKITEFQDQLLQRLAALPVVHSAALASGIPFSFYEDTADLIVQGASASPPGDVPVTMSESVSADYFRSMRIPLREGREFNSGDTRSGLPVCIVSRSMAQRFWPGQSALGKQLKTASPKSVDAWITVVGVVADVQHEIYDRSFRSILYRPYQQAPPRAVDFALRAGSKPLQLAAVIRAEIRKLDPDLPVENLQSMSALIASQASALQYVAVLMAAFGGLALILAAVGVYGVMANSVTERWREIAIRMALGAHSGRLLATVMRRALLFAAIGTTLGLVMALGLAKLLSSLIYGVNAWDTQTFVTAPVVLAVIALVASYLPARRATRMDTMATLRCP